MSRFSLEELPDDTLLDGLHSLVEHDRMTTADLLAHIGEVARRRLYGPMGYSSMQQYCVEVLHLSEDAAKKRVQIARKGNYLPVIFEAIADGRVHLSGMRLLVPFIDDENVHDLIVAATHRSKAEIEILLAQRFPAVPPGESICQDDASAPGHSQFPDRSFLKPVAPNLYVVQYTIDDDERERLNYLFQLMSHRNPRGSLSHLHRVCREHMIDELENEKLGETDDPRPGVIATAGRYIPRHVRRAVWKRDGGACTWVSPTGRRCGSRWLVEFDHIQPFAQGGEPTVDNVRCLCRTHNQLEAERAFGVEYMEERRAAAGA